MQIFETLLPVVTVFTLEFLVVRVICTAILVAFLLRVGRLYVALFDLLLNVLRVRQNIQTAIASGAEHFFMCQILAFEQPFVDLFSVDFAPWIVLLLVDVEAYA